MKYRTGDLFDAPKGSYLAHACNCTGRWGSGIALQFRQKFPKSYKQYHEFCKSRKVKPGEVLICDEENGYRVVCLFTSRGWGETVDKPRKIVDATKYAIGKLPTDAPIHMPKINSGLFNVPWEHTAILFFDYDDIDITVWELP